MLWPECSIAQAGDFKVIFFRFHTTPSVVAFYILVRANPVKKDDGPMEILPSTSGKTAVQVARELSLKAGDSLVRQFHQERRISFKGRGNIVTDVDKEVESEPSRRKYSKG